MTAPQAQSDDRALMAELWHRWQASISAYLFASVPNFHDAEDLLQQVAIAVARDFDKFDPDTPFIRWAIVIARNRVRHYRRTRSMSKVIFSQATIDALAQAASALSPATSDYKAELDQCIGKLQSRSRRALLMRYTEDLRAGQIAEQMNMSANAVSVLLHRTRHALETCLERALALRPSR